MTSFTGEVVISFFALATLLLNVWFFSFKSQPDDYAYTDTSVAAQLLEKTPQLNQKLFTKNNTTKTVVDVPHFFTQAFADDFKPFTDDSTSSDDDKALDQGETFAIENDMLVRGQKVDTRDLVEVYQTKDGDTLSSIAKKFHLKTETLMWANDLSVVSIKPGWYLQIPPTDGVLYEVKNGDTIGGIARKLSGKSEDILAYNGLSSGDDIEAGDLLMCVDCHMPLPAPTKTKPKSTPSPTQLAEKKEARYFGKRTRFAAGQCTDYVARVFETLGKPVAWRGNAKDWARNSAAAGASVDRIPTVGSIIQTTDNRTYGHVGYVESVGDGTVTFSEWNYKGKYIKSVRTLPVNSKKIVAFIHY